MYTDTQVYIDRCIYIYIYIYIYISSAAHYSATVLSDLFCSHFVIVFWVTFW